MKIRITQKVEYKDSVLLPGMVLEMDDKTAKRWIKADCAIEYDDEVSDGNRKNSTEME